MDDFLDSPLIRIVFAILTTGIISAILPLLFLLNLRIPQDILYWSVVLTTGFIAGIVSRILLRHSTLALQFIVAILAILVSLYILGWLTMNFIGFSWNQDMELVSTLGWAAELIVASLVAAATVRVWNGSSVKVKAPAKQPLKKNNSPPKPSTLSEPVKPANKPVTLPAKTGPKPRKLNDRKRSYRRIRPKVNVPAAGSITLSPEVKIENPPRLQRKSAWKTFEDKMLKFWQDATHIRHQETGSSIPSSKPARIRKRALPSRQTRSRLGSINVRLFGEVEHRCPYCLEVVHKKDVRGVKTCPICHTRHHLDCWNITGVCQVPHQSD